MIKCPICHSKIVWLFSQPHRGDYACRKCGHAWRKELEEQKGAFGTFLGDWTPEEITILEKSVGKHRLLYKDWYFYKGRKIFTAWRATNPTKLICTKVLGDMDSYNGLSWWVQCANLNTKWYDSYQKACTNRTGMVS